MGLKVSQVVLDMDEVGNGICAIRLMVNVDEDEYDLPVEVDYEMGHRLLKRLMESSHGG